MDAIQQWVDTRWMWTGPVEGLDPAWGVLLAFGGLIYVFLGWRIYKLLVMVNCATFGAFLAGTLAGPALGLAWAWVAVAALIGAIALGATAVSMVKVGATLSVGVVGALLGSSAAGMVTSDPGIRLVAAFVGLVLASSLVFATFEHIMILALSVQGGVMTTAGFLIAISQQLGFLRQFRESALRGSWLALFCVIALAVIGVSVQIAGLRAGGSGRSI